MDELTNLHHHKQRVQGPTASKPDPCNYSSVNRGRHLPFVAINQPTAATHRPSWQLSVRLARSLPDAAALCPSWQYTASRGVTL